MTKSATPGATKTTPSEIPQKVSWWRRWTPTRTLYSVLVAAFVLTVWASLTGNPFGAYFAAYVSTALVMFGLYELVRKLRRREPLRLVWPILIAGLLIGVFMNLSTVFGPSVYLAFLAGQAITVGLVLWLSRLTQPTSR